MLNLETAAPTMKMQIILPGVSTFTALATNRNILRISCEAPFVHAIHIATSTPTPLALTPTVLQRNKPHLPYIDVIPFPSLRDSILRGSDIIDHREIWCDILNGDFKVWGLTPWDMRGWEVQERFAIKWWWLMTDEVLMETNFWRVSRGEEPLDLKQIKQTLKISRMLN
jgi:hypothetical protein